MRSFLFVNGQYLTSCISVIYSSNQDLSFSQRLSLITGLFKKGDKNNFIFVSFIFARRLQKDMDNLLGIEQSAYQLILKDTLMEIMPELF